MDWKRLGRAVVNRRVALGHATREAFAQHAGISSRLLGDLENGKRLSYDPATLVRLERALGWAEGSVDTVLAGGDPAETHPASTDSRSTGRSPSRWLVEVEPPALQDLSPMVRTALTMHAYALQTRLERDLATISLNLRTCLDGGFEPANSVEARLLVHHASPDRARERPWRLAIATAEADQLFLVMPARFNGLLDDYPWEEMSDPKIKPSISVSLFTSPERLADYDAGLRGLPTTPAELVRAMPTETSAMAVNPGSLLALSISSSSLRDAVALIGGETPADPDQAAGA